MYVMKKLLSFHDESVFAQGTFCSLFVVSSPTRSSRWISLTFFQDTCITIIYELLQVFLERVFKCFDPDFLGKNL